MTRTMTTCVPFVSTRTRTATNCDSSRASTAFTHLAWTPGCRTTGLVQTAGMILCADAERMREIPLHATGTGRAVRRIAHRRPYRTMGMLRTARVARAITMGMVVVLDLLW